MERAIICGHSWGTLVALRMASAAPERVAGLVLMSGYYYPTPRADAVALGLPSLPLLGDLLRYTLSPLLGWLSTPLFFKLLFAPRTVTPRFARAFPVAIALRPSQIRASAAESALMPQEAATLGRARSRHGAPVLVVAGTKDRLVSYRHQSERLAREVPNATLVGIEGAGHMVHHSEPARVSDAIAAFAQRVFCPRPRG